MAITVQASWTKPGGRITGCGTESCRSLRSVAEELDITYSWAHNLLQLAGITRKPGNGRALLLTEIEVASIHAEWRKRARSHEKKARMAAQDAPGRIPEGLAGWIYPENEPGPF
jgi:hypothetical protein